MKKLRIFGKDADALNVFRAAAYVEDACAILQREIMCVERAIIEKGGTQVPGITSRAPLIVSSALSVELYLKCLLKIDTGGWPEGHDHKFLFNLLSKERQKEIRDLHHDYMFSDPTQIRLLKAEQQMLGRTDGLNFDNQLNSMSDSFVKWRYWFDERVLTPVLAGYPNTVALAVREVIIKINPDWRIHVTKRR